MYKKSHIKVWKPPEGARKDVAVWHTMCRQGKIFTVEPVPKLQFWNRLIQFCLTPQGHFAQSPGGPQFQQAAALVPSAHKGFPN
jgi:hypothetical protein